MIRIIGLLVLSLVLLTQSQYQVTLTQTERDTILAYHNGLRANYGMPPLTWSSDLETSASNYAGNCIFEHSTTSNGENLYVSSGQPSGTFPYRTYQSQMDGWKGEEQFWSCGDAVCVKGSECGHLTAMIWKTTTQVGCGVAKCPSGTVFPSYPSQYLICQYYPAGNYFGQHPLTAPNAPPTTQCPTLPTPPINTDGSTNPGTSKPTPTPTKKPTPTPTKKPTPTPTKKPTPTPTKKPTPTGSTSANWGNCIGDYWPENSQVLTPCKSAPRTLSGGLYCDVGDPEGYYWPCYNCDSTDCPYTLSAITDDPDAQKGMLPMEAWIGIAVGIAAFIIIVIIILIVVMKSKKDERV